MSQTKAQLIDTLVASLLPASDSSVDIGSNGVDSGAGGGANGGSIKVNVGDTIEGNIYSFKTETNGGGWLAYYKKK